MRWTRSPSPCLNVHGVRYTFTADEMIKKSFCKLGLEDNTWFLCAAADFNFLCLYSYLYANGKKPYCRPQRWLCGWSTCCRGIRTEFHLSAHSEAESSKVCLKTLHLAHEGKRYQGLTWPTCHGTFGLTETQSQKPWRLLEEDSSTDL